MLKINRQLCVNGSEADFDSIIIDSQLDESVVTGDSSVIKSSLTDSGVNDSIVIRATLKSTIVKNRTVVYNTLLVDCTFINSTICGVCYDVIGEGVTIEPDASVFNCTLAYGTHVRAGVWRRAPVRIEVPGAPYDVTEDTDDRVLVGCYSRPLSRWLRTTPAEACRLGLDETIWHRYIDAFLQLRDLKAEFPSPRTGGE